MLSDPGAAERKAESQRSDRHHIDEMMKFFVETEHPIAIDSPDHIQPTGTANDNTVKREFNERLKLFFAGRRFSLLDLGCAGGGMVQSFIEMGISAVGIEGSDYSKKAMRKAWGILPDNLFTADATKPFTVHTGDGQPYRFDVVTAWEFFEHIAEKDLDGVVDNILRHGKKPSRLILTTTDLPSQRGDVEHHLNQKTFGWWTSFFEQKGFIQDNVMEKFIQDCWLRNGKFKLAFRFDGKVCG